MASWLATTRWTDTKVTSIKEVSEKIKENKEKFDTDNDNALNYNNLSVSESDIFKIQIEEKEIQYKTINISYDTVYPGVTDVTLRTQNHKAIIVVYNFSNKIYYITNLNSKAQFILRRILGYTGRKEIENMNIDLPNGIFMWLIQKVFTENNEFTISGIDQADEKIIIDSIVGLRGETQDANKLQAEGDTVLNLLTVLSFILESDKLKQLIFNAECVGHENVPIRLNDKGYVSINSEDYDGAFEDFDTSKKKAAILLLVYNGILPHLIETYYEEKSDGSWGKEKRNEFLDEIQNSLIERLETRKKEQID